MAEQVKIDWKKKNYTATWGVVKFNGDAQIVAHEIESIGDGVTAQQIVDYAMENEDSELHKCFELDDKIAANKYRCEQARTIVRSLKITIIHNETNEKEITPIRYFAMTEHKCGVYEKTEVIVTNTDSYQALLKKALDELQWFKNKYHMLSELEPVFAAMDIL